YLHLDKQRRNRQLQHHGGTGRRYHLERNAHPVRRTVPHRSVGVIMPERYELDEPVAWVEFGDSWTRGEVLRFADLEGAEFFAFIGRKLTGCHLPMGDGSVLNDPALFVERLDDIDVRAFYW